MNEPILSIDRITKHFGGIVALKDVSFDVQKAEIVGLMGPNGAGKTTLLNIIAGEYTPDSGKIKFKGRDITGCPSHKTCHLGIARTYQIPQPFVTLSVRDNLLVSAMFGKQVSKAAAELEHDKILDLAGLSAQKNTLTGDLPSLSLKKLELARVLARDPEVILLDEVAAGLTEPEMPKILATLKEIRNMGKTVILVEHVMRVMVNAVDRIIVIDKGMKICEGKPETVMNDSKVIEAYFGV
jgi:branched-chain amino acid transport system ATP-binding protein